MSPPYGVFDYVHPNGGEFHLFAPAQNKPLHQRFADFCRRPIRPAAPLRVLEFEDVVLCDHPNGACLYDREGRRIEESCLARYTDDLVPEFWRAAETLDARPIRETISTPVVFQSIFFRHWGHFLLESLSRAWAPVSDPALAQLPCLFTWALGAGPLRPTYSAFLDAAGLKLGTSEGEPRKLQLAKCFVPVASFATVGYADPLQLAAPQRVARVLSGGASRDPRPVYLARTNLTPHAESRPTIRNEAELEQALAGRGARIVHMETLSLPEQIDVMNAHDVFIGPWGSALHNTLFSLRGREISTYVLLGRFLPTNFMLVDTIVGNVANYLIVLSRAEDFDATRQVLVDVEKTLAYLDTRGVFA